MNFWQFRCIQCESILALGSHGICCRCYRQIKQTPYCGRCGESLPTAALSCGECLRHEPKWHRIVQVSEYKPPFSDLIHRFKFRQHYWLDRSLARLLLLAVKKAQREQQLILPEVMIPVPLFWQRHWRRSFNQAELITRFLARWLDIPADHESLQRVRSTRSQRELNAAGRRKNVKGAFVFEPKKNYRRVAIIDDVVTTGSTVNAVCRELLKREVEEIQIWTLARA